MGGRGQSNDSMKKCQQDEENGCASPQKAGVRRERSGTVTGALTLIRQQGLGTKMI